MLSYTIIEKKDVLSKKKKNYPITLFESLSREGTFRSSYILISYLSGKRKLYQAYCSWVHCFTKEKMVNSISGNIFRFGFGFFGGRMFVLGLIGLF